MSDHGEAMIEFRGVTKSFDGKPVLKGIDLTVEKNEIMHIVGLLRPDSGEIRLDGARIDHLSEREMYAVRKRVAMVFQHATLFDSMTLVENVALPLRKHRRLGERAAEAEAMKRLEQVH